MMFEKILSMMPHKPPMLLIDRILDATDSTVRCESVVQMDNIFFRDGGIGSWIGIEYMAQAIGAHAAIVNHKLNRKNEIGYLLSVRRYDCATTRFVEGDVLQISAEQKFLDAQGLASYCCELFLNGKSISTSDITVFQPVQENK